MNVAVIKGEEIQNIKQLHDAFCNELNLPSFYGRNDALWDCLTGYISLPMTIIWKNFKASRESLGEYADRAVEVLKTAEVEVPGLSIIIN